MNHEKNTTVKGAPTLPMMAQVLSRDLSSIFYPQNPPRLSSVFCYFILALHVAVPSPSRFPLAPFLGHPAGWRLGTAPPPPPRAAAAVPLLLCHCCCCCAMPLLLLLPCHCCCCCLLLLLLLCHCCCCCRATAAAAAAALLCHCLQQ